jgi:hypothetical protein
MVVVVPQKMSATHNPEESHSLDHEDHENPPPYSPQSSSSQVVTLSRPPPELPPTNYLHIKEKNNSIKQKICLDLSIPLSQASALPGSGTDVSEMPNLVLDSHNGSVIAEVWVHRSDPVENGIKDPSKRARLDFRSENGTVKALVHVHPSMAEPRPFLQIEARAHNGSVAISIPRSFRGQITLHTDNGHVQLSSALASHAAMLSGLNGSHTYFVGERPDGDKWCTGAGGEGEKVDEVIGWSKNGSVKVSYNDEGVAGTRSPGVLTTLFRAMGF